MKMLANSSEDQGTTSLPADAFCSPESTESANSSATEEYTSPPADVADDVCSGEVTEKGNSSTNQESTSLPADVGEAFCSPESIDSANTLADEESASLPAESTSLRADTADDSCSAEFTEKGNSSSSTNQKSASLSADVADAFCSPELIDLANTLADQESASLPAESSSPSADVVDDSCRLTKSATQAFTSLPVGVTGTSSNPELIELAFSMANQHSASPPVDLLDNFGRPEFREIVPLVIDIDDADSGGGDWSADVFEENLPILKQVHEREKVTLLIL